jgi:3-phosphoglycerate kinase
MSKVYLTIGDMTLNNNMRVLLRVDFNSPMDSVGNILVDKRIKSHLETLRAFWLQLIWVLRRSTFSLLSPGL